MSNIQLQETWINHITDLSTGVELFHFLESQCKICQKEITIKDRLKDMNSVESQESNIAECLKWLEQVEKIPVSGIVSTKIVEKDEQSIVSLLSKIIGHFHVRGGDTERTMNAKITPYEEIMEWVSEAVKVPSERPKALEDWKTGEFFFNLIKSVSRNLDDPLFTSKRKKKQKNEMLIYKCIEFSFNSLGIPRIISPSTFMNPEEFSLATYLSFFKKYSKKDTSGFSLVVGSKSRDYETRQSIFETFPYRSRVENSTIKSTEFFGICKVTDASAGLKNYISDSKEGEWGYVNIFYGVNDKRRKLMICSRRERTFIFKLSDLIQYVANKKKKQVKLEKSNGEFAVLVFQRIQDYEMMCTYALLAVATREGKKMSKPLSKLKGNGTNRAIQKTYYLKGAITSTGIYSKTPIHRWTKKQLMRWFERIFFEDENGKIRSVEKILKEYKITDRFLTAVYEGNGIRSRQLSGKKSKQSQQQQKLSFRQNIGVMEGLRKTIVENELDLSKFLPKPDTASKETKLFLIQVGKRILKDVDVLEHLEVTDDPELKFFSKPFRKVFDKMTEQRGPQVRISEMEMRLKYEKPWLWDCDEFRDCLMTQLLFSYPLFSGSKDEKSVVDVFEGIFYEFILAKMNIKIEKKRKEEEEEIEGEEEEEEEEVSDEKKRKFFLELDPTKFGDCYRDFSTLTGFELRHLSFGFNSVFKVNQIREKLKEARQMYDLLEHENKILEETKMKGGEEEERQRFLDKVEENKKKMKEYEASVEDLEKKVKDEKKKSGLGGGSGDAKLDDDDRWIFLRSLERRQEIEKMNRSRMEHILGEFKRQDKEPFLAFPVQLFLWRRKPAVSPEFRKDIMKEVDPMLSTERYRFGYVHSSFVFPSLELVWTPNSLVRLKHLDVSGGYHPIVGIEVPCVMLGTYEEVRRRFEELSIMLMKWNTKRIYSTSGMSKKKGKRSFDFVMEILGVFDLMMNPWMEDYVQDLEKMLAQGVSSRQNLKFLTIPEEFEVWHKEIIKKYKMDPKTRRISFDTHKKLDEFVKDVRSEESKRRSKSSRKENINNSTMLSHMLHCVDHMCLGFDNAFKERYHMMKDDDEKEKELCEPSESGCSFYQE